MPDDTIKNAVKRGTGEIEGAAYEEVLYEGTGPAGTLYLVEGMTDNRNRTVAEIRKIFEKNNGNLGGARRGRLGVRSQGHHPARQGRRDRRPADGSGRRRGRRRLQRRGRRLVRDDPAGRARHRARSARSGRHRGEGEQLGVPPEDKKPMTGRDAEVCLNLAEALDDHDDVQNVYADFDISDEEIARSPASKFASRHWGFSKYLPPGSVG